MRTELEIETKLLELLATLKDKDYEGYVTSHNVIETLRWVLGKEKKLTLI